MDEIAKHIGILNETLPYLMQKVGIAALIGLFIGIERESKKTKGEKFFGGIRTIPLISLLGFLSALIASITNVMVFVGMLVVFGILLSINYFFSAQKGELGATTEVSFLLVFILGALVYWDLILLAASVTVILGIFLAFKSEFRTFAGVISDEDIFATIKFAVLTLIILPLLPNESYGPFDAFNPRRIWLMVVLIAAVSFVGYVLFKIIGTKKGVQLLSVLGGLASSTALTLSFTQRSRELPELSRNFAAGIILASSILFPRILLIVYLLKQDLAATLILPTIIFTLVGVVTSFFIWRGKTETNVEEIKLDNPFKVMAALKFGLIFAIVLLISSAAKEYFGEQGIYYSSLLSGFADVDAVALSIADLVNKSLAVTVGTVAIVLATLSNSIVKASIAVLFGAKELKKYVVLGFIPMIIAIIVYSVMELL